ncbi:MAG TPA: alpha/beta hydrolase-fold protein [Chryseolinea sp.]|nr:alpha/beta hydrolase-fold protein [Chryseolinea sp.]
MSICMYLRFIALSISCLSFVYSFAAKVDSLDVPSAAMHKTYKAVIVLPDSYSKSKASYPVLYLLHGGGGHFSDWMKLTPDKMLVKDLADQNNLISSCLREKPLVGTWTVPSTREASSRRTLRKK